MGGGGKGGGKGQGKGKDGEGYGGKNQEPGQWPFLRDYRMELAEIMKVGAAEFRTVVSACDDAEKDLHKESCEENLVAFL